MPSRRWSWGGGGGHLRRILQEIRPPPEGIPLHIVLICKGMCRILQVFSHSTNFCRRIWRNFPFLPVLVVPGLLLLPSAGWLRHGGRGLPPLPVAVCPLLGREHRPPGDSPSLPSPLLFSLGHCLRLVESVLLWCSPASGVPLVFLVLVSALLGMVVYGGIFFFIQPRPELTRTHA